MTQLRQRAPRQRDQKHIDYVNKLPCCVCGSTRNVEAAHLKMRLPEIGKESPGLQQKADDRWVTPLCHYHHQSGIQAQHKVGEKRFWFEIHGRNPFEIASRLWVESGGEERAAVPKPVKARKVRPRKPRGKRRPVPPSRPMQSRNSFARPQA
ncbi:MAG: hypothetical protein E6Q77_00310 [Rhizobium sp.]|nr:MAG: hypothetical protein E6Q77_00310 [Rhizobium sp.]